MPEAVIVATARSPIGRARKGSLVDIRPDDLTTQIVRAALDKVPSLDPRAINDLMVGTGSPAGEQGFNIAREVAVQLGYDFLPGTTVHRYCASSLQTTRMAFHAIKAGEGEVFVSAGVECVSRYDRGSADGWPDTMNPIYTQAQERTAKAAQGGAPAWTDPREADLLPDVYIAMGQTAENVVSMTGISREEQDRWGVLSQNRAEAAIKAGFFEREITPITLPNGNVVATDDGPRPGTTYEAVSQLRPVFRPDGTVTAGNASPLTDGASAVLLMSEEKARALGFTPLAAFRSWSYVSVDPADQVLIGPAVSMPRALDKAGLSLADVDLVDIHEAFAAQTLSVLAALESHEWAKNRLDRDEAVGAVDVDKLNVHGGAIALGHPWGSTGARLTTTLLNGLAERDGLAGALRAGGEGQVHRVDPGALVRLDEVQARRGGAHQHVPRRGGGHLRLGPLQDLGAARGGHDDGVVGAGDGGGVRSGHGPTLGAGRAIRPGPGDPKRRIDIRCSAYLR